MTKEKILEDFLKRFPKAWGKPGVEFDGGSAIIWSGEGSGLADDSPCFDYIAAEWDRLEEYYTMGIANDLVAWAGEHNCFWECYDPDTYFLYEN